MDGTACGIDFGTSNTLAAVVREGQVTVCELDPVHTDPQLLPTLLYFSRRGWHRVGQAAVAAYQDDPDGRFVRALKSALPEYTPEETFRFFKETYTLPSLLRLVFEQVRTQVEKAVGGPVRRATVGRPVRFSPDPAVDLRTQEMLHSAATAAGFTEVRFLTEPEAATRYHFSQEHELPAATVLVFDFGGGTLDLCLARFGPEGYQVLGRAGAHIGGTRLDRLLFEGKLLKHLGQGQKWGRGLELPYYLFNRLVNPDANWRISDADYTAEVRRILDATAASGASAVKLRTFHTVVSRRLGADLFRAIEAAKIRLSSVQATEICFETPGVRIVEPLRREELWTLFAEPIAEIRTLIAEVLDQAGVGPEQVDRVLLAGGSSALVCIQELLRETFGEERVPLRQDLFTSIVRGLALDAAAS